MCTLKRKNDLIIRKYIDLTVVYRELLYNIALPLYVYINEIIHVSDLVQI